MRYFILICSHRVYLNTDVGVFCLNTGIFYLLPSRFPRSSRTNTWPRCDLTVRSGHFFIIWHKFILLFQIIFQMLVPVKQSISIVRALLPQRDILGFFPPLVNVQLQAATRCFPQREQASLSHHLRISSRGEDVPLACSKRQRRSIKAHLLGFLWNFQLFCSYVMILSKNSQSSSFVYVIFEYNLI